MQEPQEGDRRSHVSSAPDVLRALLRCYTPRLCKLQLEGRLQVVHDVSPIDTHWQVRKRRN